MKRRMTAIAAAVCVLTMIAAPAFAVDQVKTQSQERVCVEDGSCPEECPQIQTQTRVQLKIQEQTPATEPLQAQPKPMVQTHVRVQLRIGAGDSENAPEWAKKTARMEKRLLKRAALNLGSD